MGNTRQAPILIHEGAIMNSPQFYLIDQSLIESIFRQLSGKNGNALKLILFLLGNSGSGSFRVSEKKVEDATGMSKKSYQRARAELIEMGWLRHEKGKLIVLVHKIIDTESEVDRGVNKTTLEESSKLDRGVNKEVLGSHVDGHNNISNNIKNNIKNNTSRSAVALLEYADSNEEEYDWLIAEGETYGSPLDVFTKY